jgi:hypothetical protein
MSDSLLTIRIPDEDVETKKELKYYDRKIYEHRQRLIYLESQDCRNSLLKETIEEQRTEVTAKFRIYINARHELIEKIEKQQKEKETEQKEKET